MSPLKPQLRHCTLWMTWRSLWFDGEDMATLKEQTIWKGHTDAVWSVGERQRRPNCQTLERRESNRIRLSSRSSQRRDRDGVFTRRPVTDQRRSGRRDPRLGGCRSAVAMLARTWDRSSQGRPRSGERG